jgi:hypothetical protein
MAFVPGRRTRDLLMWMLSTKMMPGVAVLVPDLPLFIQFGLLDSRLGLTVVLTSSTCRSSSGCSTPTSARIPGEILEAARMDGATLWGEVAYVLFPMAIPGIASTVLLNIILAWNEAFWTIVLTTTDAAPLTKFISGFSSPQGSSTPSSRPPRSWRIATISSGDGLLAEAASSAAPTFAPSGSKADPARYAATSLSDVAKRFRATWTSSRVASRHRATASSSSSSAVAAAGTPCCASIARREDTYSGIS